MFTGRLKLNQLKYLLNDELRYIALAIDIEKTDNNKVLIHDSKNEKRVTEGKVFGIQLSSATCNHVNIVRLYEKDSGMKSFKIHPLYIDDTCNLYERSFTCSDTPIELSKFSTLDEAIQFYNINPARKDNDDIIIILDI